MSLNTAKIDIVRNYTLPKYVFNDEWHWQLYLNFNDVKRASGEQRGTNNKEY